MFAIVLLVKFIRWRESFKAVILLDRFLNGIKLILLARQFPDHV